MVLLGAGAAELANSRQGLTAQREAIHSEWPNVSAALERRGLVVAKLAEIVKGYSKTGDAVFNDIAEARSVLSVGSTPQQEIQANSRLMEASARLFLFAERYPKLNAGREYRRTMEEMKEAENAVALERRKYNELLEHYNAQLQRFPDNIAARISGFSRIDDYVITEQEIH
jgi:LemA protein